jgi:hypothetical protein
MVVTLDAKRRLSLPKQLIPAHPGDAFEAVFDPEEDTVTLRRLTRGTDWLAVLKSCPVAMDDLPARSREYFRPRL